MYKLLAIVCAATLVTSVIAWPKSEAKNDERTLIKTCFDGYTLTAKGVCVQEVDETPRPYCPSGEVEGAGCRLQVQKIRKCADGYKLDKNGNCSFLTVSPVKYFCPAGFLDDGEKCVQKLAGELVDFCVDSDRVADHCVRLTKAQPELSTVCPEGATLEAGACWKISETFDCTDQYICSKRIHDQHLRNGKTRNLSGEEKLVPAAAPKTYKVEIIAQTCHKKFEVPSMVRHTCPQGFMDDGVGCFKEDVFPLQSKCVATGGPPESCPPIINYASKVTRCSDGSLGVKGMCTEYIIGENIDYCPTGFIDDGSSCEGYLEAPLECPPDLTLKNDRCVGKRIHPAVLLNTDGEEEEISKTPLVGKEPHVFHHLKSRQ